MLSIQLQIVFPIKIKQFSFLFHEKYKIEESCVFFKLGLFNFVEKSS